MLLSRNGHMTPWQLGKRCQAISISLDHAKSQSVNKTNIRQNARQSDHKPCVVVSKGSIT